MYELPAYLFWGFLESGKTTLIKETLSQDYFNDGEKTMILTFEEGEEEFDKEMLEKTNSFVIHLDKIEDFTKEFVISCQKNYYPDRIMIEYNGMYQIEGLMDVIDETDIELYQAIVTVDASTADMYMKNMKSLFVEMFKMADLVIFNRCDDNTNVGSYRRSIKAVNPRAQVGFERADGREMKTEEMLPYDINADVIKIEDDDYGVWYIDAMERSDVYDGKVVEFKAEVRRSPKMPPGMIIPGRKAMTCCEDDITFIGYLCRLNQTKSKTLKRILNKEWVTLTAQIHVEYNEAYQKTMPVLNAIRIEKAEPPKQQLIYF
ncbi:TIGR03943 family putative permease subunit [Anaerostipes sp. MSJ-23]|uniref:TIGR03943 family putative permease subunit n=1 Tax=unclassified Anaerostipes TaxID=2635253 RepID=UPI001C10551D|nr:GTP-binding protein [Anaerostipes sp. MSJ-23]MBU5459054.1 GTPase [Anaerostipes sp. MSJ-23]